MPQIPFEEFEAYPVTSGVRKLVLDILETHTFYDNDRIIVFDVTERFGTGVVQVVTDVLKANGWQIEFVPADKIATFERMIISPA